VNALCRLSLSVRYPALRPAPRGWPSVAIFDMFTPENVVACHSRKSPKASFAL
jgi:hypothetical protein